MGRLKTVLGAVCQNVHIVLMLIQPISRLLFNPAIFLNYLHDQIPNMNAYPGIVDDYSEVQSNKSAHLLPHEYFQVS